MNYSGTSLYLQQCSKKYFLFKHQTIRKVTAAVMLIIFAFSVTPTILLHNWTANHIDSVKKLNDTDQQQLSKKLYNCHCDSIVAESPFTEHYGISISPVITSFLLPGNNRPVLFPESVRIFHSLRGPPIV